MVEEIFLDFSVPRANVPECTHVRSTLLGSSVLALKKHGHFDRYAALLPREYHDEVIYGVAGHWVPIAVGRAHYVACTELGLEPHACATIGASVAQLAQKTAFSFVLRLATESGVTPWTILAKSRDFWTRAYKGSDVAVFKLGPKECRFEIVNTVLAEGRYWRASYGGIMSAIAGAFCRKVFVRELPWNSAMPASARYRMSWV